MQNYRTVDCEVWARRFIKKHQGKGFMRLIEIKPQPPGRYLGGILMPTGMQTPLWYNHFAVLLNGKIHDEAYPDGLPQEQFKARFEYREVIDFIERSV